MTKCFTTALLLLVALVAVMLALADASANVRQLKTAERRELYRRYVAHKAKYDLDHGEAGSDEDIDAFTNYEVTQELIRNQVDQVPDWAVFDKRMSSGQSSGQRCSYAQIGTNVFATWSDQRFNDFYSGLINDTTCKLAADRTGWSYAGIAGGYGTTTSSGVVATNTVGSPPTTFTNGFVPQTGYIDWSNAPDGLNHLSSVDDQGTSCSSCWAYSFASALESMYSIKGDSDIWNNGTIRKLSITQLTGCSNYGLGFAKCDPRSGMPTWALQYLAHAGGIFYTREGFTNYTASAALLQLTNYNAELFCVLTPPSHNRVDVGWNPTWAVCGYDLITRGDEQALAARLTYGPIIVGLDHGFPAFRCYTGPQALVVQLRADGSPGCSQTELSHSMVATGIVADSCGAYWVVKNSWGTGWGINGYLHLLAGGNQCGIATFAVALRMTNRYRDQWDPTGVSYTPANLYDPLHCLP